MRKGRILEVVMKLLVWALALFLPMLIKSTSELETLKDYGVAITVSIFIAFVLPRLLPSERREGILRKALKNIGKDDDKAAHYLEMYLESPNLKDSEREDALKLLSNVYYEKGDTGEALNYLEQALGMHEREDEEKGDILGTMGLVYAKAREYQKAVEYFDEAFEILLGLRRLHMDRLILLEVFNVYINADEKQKAVDTYNRMTGKKGFRRDKELEKLLGIEEDEYDRKAGYYH